MKYLISSDFHINQTKRLLDSVQNMRTLEKASQEHQPDVYINAGDIFDKRKPTPMELKIIANHILNINARKKLIVTGNHDMIDEELSTLDWAQFENVKIAKEFKLKDKNYKIYIGHQTIKEAEVGQSNIHLGDKSYKKLSGDVIILGGIHKSQILNEKNPLVFYPGSIERINFGELGEEKFYWILTIKNKKIKLEKFPFKLRPMHKILYNLETREIELDNKIVKNKKLLKKSVKDAVLKVTFIGRREIVTQINVEKLYKLFGKAYTVDFTFEYTNVRSAEKITQKKKLNDEEIINSYCGRYKIKECIKKTALKIAGLL